MIHYLSATRPCPGQIPLNSIWLAVTQASVLFLNQNFALLYHPVVKTKEAALKRMGNVCSTCGMARAAIDTASTVIEDTSSTEMNSSYEASTIITGSSGTTPESVRPEPCPKAAHGSLYLPIERRRHPYYGYPLLL